MTAWWTSVFRSELNQGRWADNYPKWFGDFWIEPPAGFFVICQ